MGIMAHRFAAPAAKVRGGAEGDSHCSVARWRDDAHMPLDLTDEELGTAATAGCAMAYQESERAKKQDGEPGHARAGRAHRAAVCGTGGEVRGGAQKGIKMLANELVVGSAYFRRVHPAI
jgi:hypothetical protein